MSIYTPQPIAFSAAKYGSLSDAWSAQDVSTFASGIPDRVSARATLISAAGSATYDGAGWGTGQHSIRCTSSDVLSADASAAAFGGAIGVSLTYSFFFFLDVVSVGNAKYFFSLGNSANGSPFIALRSDTGSTKWQWLQSNDTGTTATASPTPTIITGRNLVTVIKHAGTDAGKLSMWHHTLGGGEVQLSNKIAFEPTTAVATTLNRLGINALRRSSNQNLADQRFRAAYLFLGDLQRVRTTLRDRLIIENPL